MLQSQSDTLGAIGNTPLVKLNKLPGKDSADIYVKLEYFNPTGSYKDRMAKAIIEEALRRGDIHPGSEVVEYTGGSTGSSLAFVCAVKGLRFRAISSDAFAKEKLQIIRVFGATLEVVNSESGLITPELFAEMERRTEKYRAAGAYWTRQFENEDVLKGYEGLGRELIAQAGNSIDIFCAGIGTGGMVSGVSRVFRQSSPMTRIIALEPASSPLLTKGIKGSHRIEGVSSGRELKLVSATTYDEAMVVEEAEAREMARRLASEEGILTGASSGMNVCAALKLARQLGPGKTVVTVAVDSGLKYLAGDLFENLTPRPTAM